MSGAAPAAPAAAAAAPTAVAVAMVGRKRPRRSSPASHDEEGEGQVEEATSDQLKYRQTVSQLQDAYRVIGALFNQLMERNADPERIIYGLRVVGLCGHCKRSTPDCECNCEPHRHANHIIAFLEKSDDRPAPEPACNHMLAILLRCPHVLVHIVKMITAGGSRESVAACVVCCFLLDHRMPVGAAMRTCLRLCGRAGMTLGTRIVHGDAHHEEACAGHVAQPHHARGETVLSHACRLRPAVAIELLTELKGNADDANSDGDRPLSIALDMQGDVTLIPLLLARSSTATLNHSTTSTAPPIFLALEWFLGMCDGDDGSEDDVSNRSDAVEIVRMLLCKAEIDGSGINILDALWNYESASDRMASGIHFATEAAEVDASAIQSEVEKAMSRVRDYRSGFVSALRSTLTPALTGIGALVILVGQYTVPRLDALLQEEAKASEARISTAAWAAAAAAATQAQPQPRSKAKTKAHRKRPAAAAAAAAAGAAAMDEHA